MTKLEYYDERFKQLTGTHPDGEPRWLPESEIIKFAHHVGMDVNEALQRYGFVTTYRNSWL